MDERQREMRARSVALEFFIFIFVSVVAIATMATDKQQQQRQQHIRQGGNAAQHREPLRAEKKWENSAMKVNTCLYTCACIYVFGVGLVAVRSNCNLCVAENISWKRSKAKGMMLCVCV